MLVFIEMIRVPNLAAIVGTVSGTSISFGSLVELSAGQSDWISYIRLNNGKVVIAFTYNPILIKEKQLFFKMQAQT